MTGAKTTPSSSDVFSFYYFQIAQNDSSNRNYYLQNNVKDIKCSTYFWNQLDAFASYIHKQALKQHFFPVIWLKKHSK